MPTAPPRIGRDKFAPLEAMVEGRALDYIARHARTIPSRGVHTSHHAFEREGSTPCGVLTVTREGQTFPRSAMMDLRLTAEVRATPGECTRYEFSEWCWSMWQAVRCMTESDLSFDYAEVEAVSYPGETRKSTEDNVRIWATDLMLYGFRQPDAGAGLVEEAAAVFLDIDTAGNRLLIDSAGNFLQI